MLWAMLFAATAITTLTAAQEDEVPNKKGWIVVFSPSTPDPPSSAPDTQNLEPDAQRVECGERHSF